MYKLFKINTLLLIFVILTVSFSANGRRRPLRARYSVSQEFDNPKVRMNEPIKLEISLSASVSSVGGSFKSNFYSKFTPPDLSAFKVVDKSQSTQRSINIFNGIYRQTFTHVVTYFLQPVKQGLIKVGSSSMTAGGKKYYSNLLALQVLPPRTMPKAILEGQSPDTKNAGDQFVQAVISRRRAFVGEPIIVSWYSYTFSQLTEAPKSELPDAPGFFNKSLLRKRKYYEAKRVAVGKDTYIRYLLYKRIYWPQRSGKLTIGSRTINLYTRNTLLSNVQSIVRTTSDITFDILPLPTNGKPKNFNEDNVGDFTIKTDLVSTSLKTNEAIDVTYTIKGEGLLSSVKLASIPKLSWGRLEKNGAPVVSERVVGNSKVLGKSVSKYILIPTKAGIHTFPPIKLHYFNPRKGKYMVSMTKAVKVTVAKSKTRANNAKPRNTYNSSNTKENILAPKIKPLSVSPVTKSSVRARFSGGILFWVLFIFPPLGFIFLVIIFTFIDKRNSDIEGILLRKHKSSRKSGLKAVSSYIKSGKIPEFYGELTKLITDAITYKIGRSAIGLTTEEVAAHLESSGATKELVEKIHEALESFDFARYSPSSSGDSSQLDESLETTKHLIVEIDKLKKGGE